MSARKVWELHEAKARELARQPESLLEFFQSAAGGRTLDLTRKRDTTRKVKW
jgi:hypothetical protein